MMNNEPVSRQYCSTLERIVVRQQTEIEVLKEKILSMETREPFLWELLRKDGMK